MQVGTLDSSSFSSENLIHKVEFLPKSDLFIEDQLVELALAGVDGKLQNLA